MITLNLLPPEEKSEIKSQEFLRRIFTVGGLGLVFILSFLVLLFSVWLFLVVQLNSVDSISKRLETDPQSKALKEFGQEVVSINSEMRNFDKLSGQVTKYSDPIKEIIDLTPPGIKFKNISINQKKIIFDGQASSRDSLLFFQDALTKSADFENLVAPIGNLLKQENIDFSFSLEIKNK